MSWIYLLRHGQAGSRGDYDRLSELGRTQATLLGEYLAAQGLAVRALITGALRRQRETAELVARAFGYPEVRPDPQWNEFDLDAVYQAIAPRLAAEDPQFRQAYEDLEREAANDASPVHRRWTSSDIAVVRAWIEGRFTGGVESWTAFKQRIKEALLALDGHGDQDVVVVSTSATPIALCAGVAMELNDRQVMRTAGALYNASFHTFRMRGGEAHISSLNNIPHLERAGLRTYR